MIRAVKAARALHPLAAKPRLSIRQRCKRTMAAAPRAAPNFQLLQYEYVPDILEKRGPHREGHLAAAEGLRAQGKCLLGGAFGDPVEGGLFVLKGMSKEEIESFVSDDPYVKAGLVTKWCEPPPPMHVDHACRHRVASLRGFGSYTTMNILCLHDCP